MKLRKRKKTRKVHALSGERCDRKVWKFILKRVLLSIVILFFVAFIIYALMGRLV